MYDIFYVSKETVSQLRWSEFKKRFPRSQKIENADIEFLKNKSLTKFFWVVWDDVIIEDNFNLDYRVPVYDENYVHVFKNGKFYDGICLISKYHQIAKKEFDNRFFTDKKEIDILASNPAPYDVFHLTTYEDYLSAIEKSSASMFWGIWKDIEVLKDFDFNYQVLKQDQHITHIFKNGRYYDGVCLFSKYVPVGKKEFSYRFFSNKKEVDILASHPKAYDKFNISNYDEYVSALDKSSTEMFWAIWNDIELANDFNFDYQVPRYNQHITHIFKNKDFFDGLCLMSKNKPITKKELEHRFFIEKKEVDIVASFPKPFEKFIIDTYEDYLNACDKSTMKMFWIVPKEVEIFNFNFDLYFNHHDSYDRNMNHVFQHIFRNDITYNGISCVPATKKLSKKEIEFRFPIEKKQYEIVASKLRPYDIIFISYNEINADDNFKNLQTRFPRAKRIHGVKGIHNAHKAAAEISTTNMFYVVDGDAEIIESFNFDYEVSRYERDIVHVWQSLNPINDLTYGYGGVKLLPTDLVLSMNTNSVDMTLSISDRFKVMKEVSNKTRFDTDEFSTWKSAFRECVKLSSRAVDETYDEETDFRLQTWCSKGEDKQFGKFCIDGAKAGREYGYDNIGIDEALIKINDFEWLKNIYEQRAKNIHP